MVEAVGKEEVVDKEGLPRPARELLPMSYKLWTPFCEAHSCDDDFSLDVMYALCINRDIEEAWLIVGCVVAICWLS